MNESYIEALTTYTASEDDYRFGGGVSDQDIIKSECSLNVLYSKDYRQFLREIGWLEINNMYFFGINKSQNQMLPEEGCVVRMTEYARNHWKLPLNMIVIYSSEDEYLWCLKDNHETNNTTVYGFDTELKKLTDYRVGDSFKEVFLSYLRG